MNHVVRNEEVADGTERLATQYGAKVFRELWKGFTTQKNSALDKTSQPWLSTLAQMVRISVLICEHRTEHDAVDSVRAELLKK